MKSFKIIILLLISTYAYSQNLIQNPSFENTAGSQPGNCSVNYMSIPTPWQMRNSCDFYKEGSQGPSYCQAHTGFAFERFGATSGNSNHVGQYIYREYAIQSVYLTAGITYNVEFWVKRDAIGTTMPIGAHFFSSNQAGCSSTAPACSALIIQTPHIVQVIPGNITSYVKVRGFYTPSVSQTYYMTIGHFWTSPADGVKANFFFLDDVSVTPCNGVGNPNPQLSLNANAFCENDPIRADGSTSTNVDCYRWELWDQGGTTFLTASLWQTGTPSSNYNVNNLYNLQKGNCYRLKLVTVENCDQQEAFEDFCIEDPEVALSLTGNNPACEGDNLAITATGDNGWTYAWSTGQTGTGLKNINVITNTNITQYSVTVTTSAGCTHTETIPVTVHSNNNTAPTTGGINNTGIFNYYVQANSGAFSFTVPTFDAANEEIDISVNQSFLPNNSTFVGDQTFHETGTFTWGFSGPTLSDVGSYSFNVTVYDNNACNPLSQSFTYNINVVCDYCPLDVYYQDRHPNNKPLPTYTVAGRKIVAGYNVISNQPFGNVETGTANVTFEAAQIIEMNPGFTGGTNYTAIINPNACTANCQNCCDNNNGFTLDQPIGNFFTPDGDGIQDIWQVTDTDHPYCAYNAKEFNLQIFNRWGNRVHHKNISSVNCCPFRSVSANTPSVVSSINWDGRVNFGPWASAGTYFYVLVLNGCNNSNFYIGDIHLFNSQARMAYEDSLTRQQMLTEAQLDSVINWVKEENGIALDVEPMDLNPINELVIYPNPTVENINVSLTGANYIGNSLIEIYNMQGQLIWNKHIFGNSLTINATSFAKGTYLVRMLNNKTTYTKTFIKQ